MYVIQHCFICRPSDSTVSEARVADPGCLSRIPIFTHPGSRISDPGSKNSNKRGVKKNLLSYLFCSHKFRKIENYFIFEMLKNLGQFLKNCRTFYPENCN
jgi:hypothetical protein